METLTRGGVQKVDVYHLNSAQLIFMSNFYYGPIFANSYCKLPYEGLLIVKMFIGKGFENVILRSSSLLLSIFVSNSHYMPIFSLLRQKRVIFCRNPYIGASSKNYPILFKFCTFKQNTIF